MINELLKLIFDESMMQSGPPVFKPEEINSLFGFLRYPYTIRADAIKAVGAPSTVGFLIKALYWLYILAATHYAQGEQVGEDQAGNQEENGRPDHNEEIIEEDSMAERRSTEQVSDTAKKNSSKTTDIFQDILDSVLAGKGYEDSVAKQRVLEKHECFYRNLSSNPGSNTSDQPRPLLQLMMHEFCEYMNHQSPDVTLDDAFTWFTSRIQQNIDLIASNTQEKQQIAAGVLQKNENLRQEIQDLNLDAKQAEIDQAEQMLQQQHQE